MTSFIFSVYLFVMVGRPQDYLPFLEAFRPALVLGIVSALALIMSGRIERIKDIFRLSESRKYLFFYLIMILGIPFSLWWKPALEFSFLKYSSNMLFFFVFILANDSFEKLKKSIFIIILAIATYGAFCLGKGELAHGRFYGGLARMFDPNDLAYLFVSFLPITLYYLTPHVGKIRKGIGLFTLGVSILIIMLAASRAGIITLLITFIIILLTINFSIKKKIFLVCILIAISIIYSDKINVDRYRTIFDIGEDYNVNSEEGRLSIWKKGLRIIWEHPITGVGVTLFPDAIGNIRLTMDLPRARFQPSHSSFVQIACELGLIGFGMFLSLIYGCLRNFYALSQGRNGGKFDGELRTISRVLFISAIATSIAGAFLTQGYSIIFTLVFAFSATLRHLNQRVNEGNLGYLK